MNENTHIHSNNEEIIGHGYYITVPMALVLDESISPKAKLLFGVIANLCNQRGYCFATNKYIGDLMGWHRDTVSGFINELIKKEWLIPFEEITPHGSQRRLKMGEFPQGGVGEVAEGGSADSPRGVRRNGLDPLGEMAEQNNINLNNKKKNNKYTTPLGEREKKFYDTLCPYVSQYGHELIREFFDYWTEKDAAQRTMRFEDQKKFEIAKRLARWQRNQKSFSPQKKKNPNPGKI